MPFPHQREDAADWIRQTDLDRRQLYTAAHSGPGRIAHIPLYPSDLGSIGRTLSGTFAPVWATRSRMSFPRIQVDGDGLADPGATGFVRLSADGIPFGDEVLVDDVLAPFVLGPFDLPSGPEAWTELVVEARLASGASGVWIAARGCHNLY